MCHCCAFVLIPPSGKKNNNKQLMQLWVLRLQTHVQIHEHVFDRYLYGFMLIYSVNILQYLGITQRTACSVGPKSCYSTLKNRCLKQSFCLWRQSLFVRKETYAVSWQMDLINTKFNINYRHHQHWGSHIWVTKTYWKCVNVCFLVFFLPVIDWNVLPVLMHWCLLQTLQQLWRFVGRRQRPQYFPAPISGLPADPRNPSCPERVRLQCSNRKQEKSRRLLWILKESFHSEKSRKNGHCDTVDVFSSFLYLKPVTEMWWTTQLLTSEIPECQGDTE